MPLKMKSYVVKFGARTKRIAVEIDGNLPFVDCLMDSVRNKMIRDKILGEQVAGRDFVLTQFDPLLEQNVEIDEDTLDIMVDDARPIEFFFLDEQNLMIPTAPQKSGPPTATTGRVDAGGSEDRDLQYLRSIGVISASETRSKSSSSPVTLKSPPQSRRRTTMNQDRAASPLSHRCRTSPKVISSKRKTTQQQPRSPSPVDDYEARALQRREENASLLRRMKIVTSEIDASRLSKKIKQRRKKTANKEIVVRRQPVRICRGNGPGSAPAPFQPKPTADDDMLSICSGHSAENVPPIGVHEEAQGPLSRVPAVTRKVAPEPKLKREKKIRLVGKYITKNVPLPPFPKKLREQLQRSIYLSRNVNTFLRKHIERVTGDLYPTKEEYKIISKQVIRRLKDMDVALPKKLQKKIITSLSSHLRAQRNYINNIVPKRLRAKENKVLQELQQSTLSDSEVEDDEYDPDVLLKKPVMQKATIVTALINSQDRVKFLESNSVKKAMEEYPYLSHADLIICDFCTRIPISPEVAQKNVEDLMSPLACILGIEIPQTELQKIKILESVEAFFTSDETVWPSLQFWDEANQNAQPLNDIPEGQSPALVVLQNDRDATSAHLVFDGDVLIQKKNPTAFDCVGLILAPYWVFSLEYPKPYNKHMKVFEILFNGDLEDTVNKYNTRSSEMQEFLSTLLAAKHSITE